MANVSLEIWCWVWHQRLFSWHCRDHSLTWVKDKLRIYDYQIVLVNTVVMAQNHFGSCGFFFCVFLYAHAWAHIYMHLKTQEWLGVLFLVVLHCLFVCFEMGALFEPKDRYICWYLSCAEGSCVFLFMWVPETRTQILMLAWQTLKWLSHLPSHFLLWFLFFSHVYLCVLR